MPEVVKKTAIIYCRVSSLEQVDGTSLETQQRVCQTYADKEGLDVLETFIERGESAKTANRTEFNRAIIFCSQKKKKVDYFIVYKLDRFARNQDDHGVVRVNLKRYGTELRSATEPINESPVGRLMEGVIASVAEFDNSVRSERSKGGMVEKTKQGIWVWPAPLGYKRIVKGGNLVVDDEVAPYIRLAFEEYSKGVHSYRSLALFLSERGFRTHNGKKPCMQIIEKIIRKPIYYGIIQAFGIEVEGKFAPIIDEELFWKCQTKQKGKFHSGKRSVENSEFPLRKISICSECNMSLTGSSSTNHAGKKYPYYHHHKQNCSLAKFIKKESLEMSFIQFLRKISPCSKNEKVFKAVVRDVWQSNYKKLDAENARVRKEIEVLESERQKIFDMHRSGKYSDEEFVEQKNIVNTKIYQKKNLLEDKRMEEFNMEEALEYCFNLVRQSDKTWLDLEETPILRSRFQKTIFPEKVIFNGKNLGTNKMSLVYEMNQESDPETSTLVTLQRIEL